MSCPTCDKTMQCVVASIFWCPTCGTLYPTRDTVPSVPALVERCRLFEDTIIIEGKATVEAVSMWMRLGVPEAIELPAERPPC